VLQLNHYKHDDLYHSVS